MKLRSINYLLLALLIWSGKALSAQTYQIVYSDTFTQNTPATSQSCLDWNAFRASLTTNLCYVSMTVRGTYNTTGITCTDPNAVAAMAAALRTNSAVTVNCGGNAWTLCNRYQGEFWINPPSQCSGSNCPNGYIIRPCISVDYPGNVNWGGVNTATCSGPTQRMTLIFEVGTGYTLQPNDSIVGTGNICVGDTFTYTIDTTLGINTYTWTPPSGSTILTGQGSNTITMVAGSTGGTLLVEGTSSCGTYPVDSVSLAVTPTLSAGGAMIAGQDSLCPGDTVVFTTSVIPGATGYNWSVPISCQIIAGNNTNSITVAAGQQPGAIGWVIVSATNACESITLDTLSIYVEPAPMGGTLTGPGQLCVGDTGIFTLSGASGVNSYNWATPGSWTLISGQGTGTASFVVGSSDSLSVEGMGICETVLLGQTYVVVDSIPAMPGAISGPDTACWGDTLNYSVAAVAGATGYTWTFPSGTSIIAGSGTATVTVVAGGASGTVSATADNPCGASGPASQMLSIDSCLVGVASGLAEIPIRVFPNPNAGTFQVEIPGSVQGPVSLSLADLRGRVVATRSVTGGGQFRMEIPEQPEGLYLLRVVTNGTVNVQKVVIRR